MVALAILHQPFVRPQKPPVETTDADAALANSQGSVRWVSSHNSISDFEDRWVGERELAGILGLSCNTLRGWRRGRNIGPLFSRFGPKAIRYRLGAAIAWAESQGRAAAANTPAPAEARA